MKTTYPNETTAYRQAREELALEEQALISQVKAVAEKRRSLPLGGRLKEDYVFDWANDSNLDQRVSFSELFDNKKSLILYSFMFGPSWDNPCPSCTSIVDSFNGVANQVAEDAAFIVIGKAPASRIND
jgi:predicted dithiol-disulfide oxidoreductase (DUF899 family)